MNYPTGNSSFSQLDDKYLQLNITVTDCNAMFNTDTDITEFRI